MRKVKMEYVNDYMTIKTNKLQEEDKGREVIVRDGFGIFQWCYRLHDYMNVDGEQKYLKDLYKEHKYFGVFKKENGDENAFKKAKNRYVNTFITYKEAVEYINNHPYFLSEEEYKRKVIKPNKDNDYKITAKELAKLVMKHKNGDLKTKEIVIRRLLDLTFNKYVSTLTSLDYISVFKMIREDIKQGKLEGTLEELESILK